MFILYKDYLKHFSFYILYSNSKAILPHSLTHLHVIGLRNGRNRISYDIGSYGLSNQLLKLKVLISIFRRKF